LGEQSDLKFGRLLDQVFYGQCPQHSNFQNGKLFIFIVGNVLRMCVYESDRFGGGSVMVWAGICHDGCTQLKIVQGTLNAIKYSDDILDLIVLTLLQQRKFDKTQ
jgi:hypothetical protein